MAATRTKHDLRALDLNSRNPHPHIPRFTIDSYIYLKKSTKSAISKMRQRLPHNICRIPPVSNHSSLTPSPLSSTPPISSYDSEEDLTMMEFLDDEDIVTNNKVTVAEDPVGIPDSDYYMTMVVFKVEGVLFRVPMHFFRSCTKIFDPLFEEFHQIPEDQRVIQRDDVNKEDFRALLKLLYPMTFAVTQTLSDNEWISVLRVSTTWLMLDIRRIAIKHLTSAPLSLVNRISLARKYSIISWLRSAYLALVEVDSELSRHDSSATEIVGLESSFKLHRVRESVLPAKQRNLRFIDRQIEKKFEKELETLGYKTAVERAVLAQEYSVSEWRKSAFVAMTSRAQIVSFDEARTLGLETAIRLCGARELRHGLGSERAVDQELEWDFGALKSYPAVKRVVMAREYGVRNWFKGGLSEVAVREESLSMPEARDLGLQTAIALCQMRHYSSQVSPGEAALSQALELEFDEEFKQVEAAGRELVPH